MGLASESETVPSTTATRKFHVRGVKAIRLARVLKPSGLQNRDVHIIAHGSLSSLLRNQL